MSFADYLDLEALLHYKVGKAWAKMYPGVYDGLEKLVAGEDWAAASEYAQQIDLSELYDAVKSSALTVFQGCIAFGADAASNGRALIPGLDTSSVLKASLAQFQQQIELNCTVAVQDRALQLIARLREIQIESGKAHIHKADRLKSLVSFKEGADNTLKMLSSLHTSRLSSWGFLAEADVRGLTKYRITAHLDNRTSAFCRMIHGKEFLVDDARALLDQATSADNPDDLKVIQPWPKQDPESVKLYADMTYKELVDARLQCPPYHPFCRTLIVQSGKLPRLEKPPAPPESPLPEFEADKVAFSDIGVKMSAEQIKLWNENVKLNPAQVVSRLSGYSIQDVMAGKAKPNIKVFADGTIRLGWETSTDTVGFKGVLNFKTSSGVLEQAVANFGTTKTGGIADYFLHYQKAVKDVAVSVAADSVLISVGSGQAMTYLSLGYVPEAAAWSKMKIEMADLINTVLKEDWDGLSSNMKSAIKGILASKNPKSAIVMMGLDFDKSSFLEKLVQPLEFTASLPLNDNAIQKIFGSAK